MNPTEPVAKSPQDLRSAYYNPWALTPRPDFGAWAQFAHSFGLGFSDYSVGGSLSAVSEKISADIIAASGRYNLRTFKNEEELHKEYPFATFEEGMTEVHAEISNKHGMQQVWSGTVLGRGGRIAAPMSGMLLGSVANPIDLLLAVGTSGVSVAPKVAALGVNASRFARYGTVLKWSTLNGVRQAALQEPIIWQGFEARNEPYTAVDSFLSVVPSGAFSGILGVGGYGFLRSLNNKSLGRSVMYSLLDAAVKGADSDRTAKLVLTLDPELWPDLKARKEFLDNLRAATGENITGKDVESVERFFSQYDTLEEPRRAVARREADFWIRTLSGSDDDLASDSPLEQVLRDAAPSRWSSESNRVRVVSEALAEAKKLAAQAEVDVQNARHNLLALEKPKPVFVEDLPAVKTLESRVAKANAELAHAEQSLARAQSDVAKYQKALSDARSVVDLTSTRDSYGLKVSYDRLYKASRTADARSSAEVFVANMMKRVFNTEVRFISAHTADLIRARGRIYSTNPGIIFIRESGMSAVREDRGKSGGRVRGLGMGRMPKWAKTQEIALLMQTASHEMAHAFRTRDPVTWKRLVNFTAADSDGHRMFQQAWEEAMLDHGALWEKMSVEKRMDEAFAYMFTNAFGDEAFWYGMHRSRPALFSAVVQFLEHLAERIKRLMRGMPDEKLAEFSDFIENLGRITGMADFDNTRGITGSQAVASLKDIYTRRRQLREIFKDPNRMGVWHPNEPDWDLSSPERELSAAMREGTHKAVARLSDEASEFIDANIHEDWELTIDPSQDRTLFVKRAVNPEALGRKLFKDALQEYADEIDRGNASPRRPVKVVFRPLDVPPTEVELPALPRTRGQKLYEFAVLFDSDRAVWHENVGTGELKIDRIEDIADQFVNDAGIPADEVTMIRRFFDGRDPDSVLSVYRAIKEHGVGPDFHNALKRLKAEAGVPEWSSRDRTLDRFLATRDLSEFAEIEDFVQAYKEFVRKARDDYVASESMRRTGREQAEYDNINEDFEALDRLFPDKKTTAEGTDVPSREYQTRLAEAWKKFRRYDAPSARQADRIINGSLTRSHLPLVPDGDLGKAAFEDLKQQHTHWLLSVAGMLEGAGKTADAEKIRAFIKDTAAFDMVIHEQLGRISEKPPAELDPTTLVRETSYNPNEARQRFLNRPDSAEFRKLLRSQLSNDEAGDPLWSNPDDINIAEVQRYLADMESMDDMLDDTADNMPLGETYNQHADDVLKEAQRARASLSPHERLVQGRQLANNIASLHKAQTAGWSGGIDKIKERIASMQAQSDRLIKKLLPVIEDPENPEAVIVDREAEMTNAQTLLLERISKAKDYWRHVSSVYEGAHEGIPSKHVTDLLRDVQTRAKALGMKDATQLLQEMELHDIRRHLRQEEAAQRIMHYARRGIGHLESFLDGGYRRGVENPGDGLFQRMKSQMAMDIGPIVGLIQSLGVEELWKSGELAHAVALAMEDIFPAKMSPEAKEIVTLIRDAIVQTRELQVARMNEAGASVHLLPGYVLSTTHNAVRIKSAGKDWFDFMRVNLDWDRMKAFHPDIGDEKVRDLFLNGIYDDIINYHWRDGEGLDLDIVGGNIANRVSRERTLLFKKGVAFEYDMRFGSGDTGAQMLAQIAKRAENSVFLREIGIDHKAQLGRIMNDMSYGKGDMRNYMHERTFKVTWMHLSGEFDHPENVRVAAAGQLTRAFINSAMLGKATISAMLDIATIMNTIRWAGAPVGLGVKATFNAFKAAAARSDGSASRTWLMGHGAGLSSYLGAYTRLAGADSGVSGLAREVNDFVFKWNGMNFWNKVVQEATLDILTSHLGKMDPDNLSPEAARWLATYNISPGEFRAMAAFKSEIPGLEGVRLGSDMLPDPKLRQKLMILLNDTMKYAVLEPSASDEAILRFGTKAGTYEGEAIRTMLQYKSFPLAMLRKIGRRFVNGYGEEGMFSLNGGVFNKGRVEKAVFLASGFVIGTGALAIKDILRGREPVLWLDPDQWTLENFKRTAVQSGSFGLINDLMDPSSIFGPGPGSLMDAVDAIGERGGFYRGVNSIRSLVPGASWPVLDEAGKVFLASVLTEAYGTWYRASLRRIESTRGQSSLQSVFFEE